MDQDQLNKVRLDRLRLIRARLGLDKGEDKKDLTPIQSDLSDFFLMHQIPTNRRFE